MINVGTVAFNPIMALALLHASKYSPETDQAPIIICIHDKETDQLVLRSLLLFSARLPLDLVVVCNRDINDRNECNEISMQVEIETAQVRVGGYSVVTFLQDLGNISGTTQRHIVYLGGDPQNEMREIYCKNLIHLCLDSGNLDGAWIDTVKAVISWTYKASAMLHKAHQNSGFFLPSIKQQKTPLAISTSLENKQRNSALLSTKDGTIFSVYPGHDSSMTLLNHNGKLLAVLELERLFEIRYYALTNKNVVQMEKEFRRGYNELLVQAGMEMNSSNVIHDICVIPALNSKLLKLVMEKCIRCASWRETGHHASHASQAFYDSPFRKAIIFSFDGGGDFNQNFEIFLGDRSRQWNSLERVKMFQINLGYVYMQIATYVSEVTGNSERNATAPALHLSGRMMGYVALGKVRNSWVAPLEMVFNGHKHHSFLRTIIGKHPTIQDERDFAATGQHVFENILTKIFDEYIGLYPQNDGIVVSGGCALNVLSNRKLQMRYKIPFHVSSSPNGKNNCVTCDICYLV